MWIVCLADSSHEIEKKKKKKKKNIFGLKIKQKMECRLLQYA